MAYSVIAEFIESQWSFTLRNYLVVPEATMLTGKGVYGEKQWKYYNEL